MAGNGTLVVDGGADETLSFGNTGYTAWYAGAGTDTATLLSGNTEIVLDGVASDYTVASPSAGVVTVTRIDGSEGVKTIGVDTGTGELVFDDGAAIGLGITTDATNYAARLMESAISMKTTACTLGKSLIYRGIFEEKNDNQSAYRRAA